jgi:hypothetical protein
MHRFKKYFDDAIRSNYPGTSQNPIADAFAR